MFTLMAQFKWDQKIIIFSHSLALMLFNLRRPLGVLRMGRGLTSSIWCNTSTMSARSYVRARSRARALLEKLVAI